MSNNRFSYAVYRIKSWMFDKEHPLLLDLALGSICLAFLCLAGYVWFKLGMLIKTNIGDGWVFMYVLWSIVMATIIILSVSEDNKDK